MDQETIVVSYYAQKWAQKIVKITCEKTGTRHSCLSVHPVGSKADALNSHVIFQLRFERYA